MVLFDRCNSPTIRLATVVNNDYSKHSGSFILHEGYAPKSSQALLANEQANRY